MRACGSLVVDFRCAAHGPDPGTAAWDRAVELGVLKASARIAVPEHVCVVAPEHLLRRAARLSRIHGWHCAAGGYSAFPGLVPDGGAVLSGDPAMRQLLLARRGLTLAVPTALGDIDLGISAARTLDGGFTREELLLALAASEPERVSSMRGIAPFREALARARAWTRGARSKSDPCHTLWGRVAGRRLAAAFAMPDEPFDPEGLPGFDAGSYAARLAGRWPAAAAELAYAVDRLGRRGIPD